MPHASRVPMKTKNRPVADLILAYRQDVERFAERLDTEQEFRKRRLFVVPAERFRSRPIW